METLAETERTRLRRLHERGHFDRATVHAILDAGMICHVGYVIDEGYRGWYGDAVEDIAAFLAGKPVRVIEESAGYQSGI